MTETKEQELKPCPFCGSTNIVIVEDDRYPYALCNACCANTNVPPANKDAVEWWNRRAETPAPQWSQEPPTEEGWYWHWIDRWDTPIPVRILRNRENILINTQTGFSVEPLACNVTTYWSKMIAPPPLPTERRAE